MREWGNERVREWESEGVSKTHREKDSESMREWGNERVREWARHTERKSVSEREREKVCESMREWGNERVRDWERHTKSVREWGGERVSLWENESEGLSKTERKSQWESERERKSMREWESEGVSKTHTEKVSERVRGRESKSVREWKWGISPLRALVPTHDKNNALLAGSVTGGEGEAKGGEDNDKHANQRRKQQAFHHLTHLLTQVHQAHLSTQPDSLTSPVDTWHLYHLSTHTWLTYFTCQHDIYKAHGWDFKKNVSPYTLKIMVLVCSL